MAYVGYAYLIKNTCVMANKPAVIAEVRPVTRKEEISGVIMVPPHSAPDDNDILGHIIFAIKHEGINLQVLAQALPLIPEQEIREAFDRSPNGKYLRIACFLWEAFTGKQIQRKLSKLGQAFTPLFDPEKYYTGPGKRDSRWRVIFNGIGSLDYCVTVRRTQKLVDLLSKDLLRKASEFTEQLPKDILNRTLSWAYLSETKDSFAIEKEAVTRFGTSTGFALPLNYSTKYRQLVS